MLFAVFTVSSFYKNACAIGYIYTKYYPILFYSLSCLYSAYNNDVSKLDMRNCAELLILTDFPSKRIFYSVICHDHI